MAEYTQEELMAKVLEVLTTKDKMKNKEIATILDVKKKEVDLAVNELAKQGKVEFLYLGTSYVTLPKA
ncbi:MAG: hypothetical protein ACI3U1_03180 [Peptococcaceae bacterium]